VATLLRALVALVADDRQVVVAREMTKIHEEFFRGTMAEAARYYAENKARGEVTVVVSPRSPAEEMAEGRESVDEVAARALARALVDDGLNLSRAAREVSSRLGIAKNAAYEIVHSLEGDSEEDLG
jgi:16S rRNA (cytidine1402-2'-O)-methyltransferase